MVTCQKIIRRIDIEQVDQSVECFFRQFLALLIQTFFVFLDREADDGIRTHEEVFLVRAGNEAVFVAEFPVLAAELFEFGGIHMLMS